MARKRMLDPKIWDSEQVMSLNSDQFKVYIYLISQADDAGRIKISFPLLKSRVFPFGMKPQGGLTEDSGLIWKVLELLNSTKLIKLYRDKEGSLYAHHPNWSQYQRISHATPSILPDPADCEVVPENSRGLQEPSGGLTEDSGQINIDQCSSDKENSLTSSAQDAESLVNNLLERERQEDADDPEIEDDKLPERYQIVQDVLKSHYATRLRLSDLDYIDRLFKDHAFPTVVCKQLVRVSKKAKERGKDPPGKPIPYIFSYMKDWHKKMTTQEQKRKEGPRKIVKKYNCPVCGRVLIQDGSQYGCMDCKEFYQVNGKGKLEKLVFQKDEG